MDEREHLPVLRDEVLQALDVRPDGTYVDATFGRGGHAQAILSRLGPHGRLLAMDRDPEAVVAARRRFGSDARFAIERGPFSMLAQHIDDRGWTGQVDGVLLDLGVSSPQLENARRGFSFRHDGPLDMRMDPEAGMSAAQWLNAAGEDEIARVIRVYGEERFAKKIARAICRERAQTPITTTGHLAAIAARAVATREPGKDPATRTFQAIRLHINRELEELEAVLPQAVEALVDRGRLVVISFHSLEDRIVKQFMRREASGDVYPPDLPVRHVDIKARLRVVGRAVRPGEEEIRRNPRARSAVLRVAERVRE